MLKTYHYNKELNLELGEVLPSIDIAYTTLGKLSDQRDNVVWVCHALTANSNVKDWWDGLVGNGKYFDPDKYFIVCANILGSCYGTTGPISNDKTSKAPFLKNFPSITIRDMVQCHELLREYLGIKKINILIGGSMGGYQAIEWVVEHPDVCNQLVMLASNAKQSAWGKGIHTVQRMAIENDDAWKKEDLTIASEGLKIARGIGMLHYRHYDAYELLQQDEEVTSDFKISSYIDHQGNKLQQRFDPFTYWTLSMAMDTHDISRGRGTLKEVLKKINTDTLTIGVSSDGLCPIKEQKFMAQHIKDAIYEEIDSIYGHDGFLIEYEKIENVLKKHL